MIPRHHCTISPFHFCTALRHMQKIRFISLGLVLQIRIPILFATLPFPELLTSSFQTEENKTRLSFTGYEIYRIAKISPFSKNFNNTIINAAKLQSQFFHNKLRTVVLREKKGQSQPMFHHQSAYIHSLDWVIFSPVISVLTDGKQKVGDVLCRAVKPVIYDSWFFLLFAKCGSS